MMRPEGNKRQITLTERNGSKTVYVHDSKYRNTDILYEDGTKEHFGYNGKNQRILHTDRNGNTTRMAYDNRGNLTQIINALGEKTSLTYNADNRLVILKVNGKEKLRNSYDNRGNLTASAGADRNGNRISETDREGNITSYTYDALNRLIEKRNADETVTYYKYDREGNLENITDALGNNI